MTVFSRSDALPKNVIASSRFSPDVEQVPSPTLESRCKQISATGPSLTDVQPVHRKTDNN